jgi:hypothetical protein
MVVAGAAVGAVAAVVAVVATGTVVAGTVAAVVATAGLVVTTGTGAVVVSLTKVVEAPAPRVVVVGITPCNTRESSWKFTFMQSPGALGAMPTARAIAVASTTRPSGLG